MTYQTNRIDEMSRKLTFILIVGVTLKTYSSKYSQGNTLSYSNAEITYRSDTNINIFKMNHPIKTILFDRLQSSNQNQSYLLISIGHKSYPVILNGGVRCTTS